MIVNTRRLFIKLLRTMGIDMVCDIGSMNGDDARAFRAALPRARVMAFEANPENSRRMLADRSLAEGNISVVPLAVADREGEADFYGLAADYSAVDGWRGMGSLYRRSKHAHRITRSTIKTTRLDTFLADELRPPTRLALWIDAEGKAFEVIDGATRIAEHIQLVHVEVEAAPCISPEQRLYTEVESLLRSVGLVVLATDNPPERFQFNALFVRRPLPLAVNFQVDARAAMARARFLAGRPVRMAQSIASGFAARRAARRKR